MNYAKACGAEIREVADRTREGQPVRAVVAARSYSTDRENLWHALTNAERLPRWFLPVSGHLQLGGRYQFEGNAEGSILKCVPQEELEITWEFGGQVSWVRISLAQASGRTRLTLEHTIPTDPVSEDHWSQYGPGATGVGWDLGLFSLAQHLERGGETIDGADLHKWMGSEAGTAFIRDSVEGWRAAQLRSGEDPGVADAMATRTAAFYAEL